MYGTIDIGGTKTLVGAFDRSGKLIETAKFPTPETYDQFLVDLELNVANLSTKEFISVGAAAPGLIDHRNGHFMGGGNLKWHDEPLQADIEHIFKAPVHLENDAKAAAVAESRFAGSNFETVVYITISTGIGVGICVNGNLDNTLIDAEPGGMRIEQNDEMVAWEQFASGKAIMAKYGKRASELDDPEAWQAISHNIAKGLLTIIAIVQPDLIVFGGGVGSHFEKFEKPLTDELKRYENPILQSPVLRKAVHPEEAVIYGCYELAKDAQV